MSQRNHIVLNIFLHLLTSFLIWIGFFLIRRSFFENYTGPTFDEKFYSQLIKAGAAAIYWVILYALSGIYTHPFRKSRLNDLVQIFKFTLFGVLIIFFLVFLDDKRPENINRIYLLYFFLQFIPIEVIHFLHSTFIIRQFRQRKRGFPTVILGSGLRAKELYDDLQGRKRSLGFDIKGYIRVSDEHEDLLAKKIDLLGDLESIETVIEDHTIEDILIALDLEDRLQVKKVVDKVGPGSTFIKIVPEMYDHVVGSIKTKHVIGSPLIEVNFQVLSTWEKVTKRMVDMFVSSLVLIILAPLYLLIALSIKLNSKGPVFYRQERIGKGGKPFNIIKFRTMVTDAERNGPALSSKDDPRITKPGRFLRKSRLDEFPQFWNVLIGDMSIIGPRPERQFFIDQIVKQAPQYLYLHKIRPGITSWGMVKYGYAENVDQMIERMKYDLLYLENISLMLDLKIVLYTILVMVEGRGK